MKNLKIFSVQARSPLILRIHTKQTKQNKKKNVYKFPFVLIVYSNTRAVYDLDLALLAHLSSAQDELL